MDWWISAQTPWGSIRGSFTPFWRSAKTSLESSAFPLMSLLFLLHLRNVLLMNILATSLYTKFILRLFFLVESVTDIEMQAEFNAEYAAMKKRKALKADHVDFHNLVIEYVELQVCLDDLPVNDVNESSIDWDLVKWTIGSGKGFVAYRAITCTRFDFFFVNWILIAFKLKLSSHSVYKIGPAFLGNHKMCRLLLSHKQHSFRSGYGPNQWEALLISNITFHWLGSYPEWSPQCYLFCHSAQNG